MRDLGSTTSSVVGQSFEETGKRSLYYDYVLRFFYFRFMTAIEVTENLRKGYEKIIFTVLFRNILFKLIEYWLTYVLVARLSLGVGIFFSYRDGDFILKNYFIKPIYT